MSAAEAMYFDGAPLAHVVEYNERQRLAYRERCDREAVERFKPDHFRELFAYAANRAPYRAAEDARRDTYNAAMASHYRRVRADQEARWAREEQEFRA